MCRSNTFCDASSRKTLSWLLVLLALVLVIRNWVCMPALVLGASMSPTLQDRQVVLVNKLAYLFRPPARGDIVSIWTGREWLIKRVIGLPGEEVALKKGTLLVNGEVVPEPYLEASGDVEMAPGKIPVN
ncbi:MAG TPA: signal peptidase I, partial [Verrucomicrobiae bacterium]|nr:signal peptidase I [Verrucomicrobiae bacterium]